MPFLSIIIPYRGDDAALEKTILSVLENRPRDSEVIVAHDGSYSDPYCLGDELQFIEANTANPVALANVGLDASRGSIVCLLAAGAEVHGEQWASVATNRLRERHGDTALCGVAVPVEFASNSQRAYGISLNKLGNGVVRRRSDIELLAKRGHRTLGEVSGPLWVCGFYRRDILQSIGGWNEQFAWGVADVELAMLFWKLQLVCETIADQPSLVSFDSVTRYSTSDITQLAQFSEAYGFCFASPLLAFAEVIKGLFTGQLRTSLAWSKGIVGNSAIKRSIWRRSNLASSHLAQLQNASAANLERDDHTDWGTTQRAA